MRQSFVRESWKKEQLITLAEAQLLLQENRFDMGVEEILKQSLYYAAKRFNLGYKVGSSYLFCRKKVEDYYLERDKRRRKIIISKVDCDKCEQTDCCIRGLPIDLITDKAVLEEKRIKIENVRLKLLAKKKEIKDEERRQYLILRDKKREIMAEKKSKDSEEKAIRREIREAEKQSKQMLERGE